MLKLTLANCINRDDGDREVVTTILGSYVPTLAYSSSIWLFGSASQLPAIACSWPRYSSLDGDERLTRLRFVQHQLLCSLPSFVPQFCRQALPLRQQILDVLLPLIDCSFLRFLRFLEDILSPLPGLSTKLAGQSFFGDGLVLLTDHCAVSLRV